MIIAAIVAVDAFLLPVGSCFVVVVVVFGCLIVSWMFLHVDIIIINIIITVIFIVGII